MFSKRLPLPDMSIRASRQAPVVEIRPENTRVFAFVVGDLLFKSWIYAVATCAYKKIRSGIGGGECVAYCLLTDVINGGFRFTCVMIRRRLGKFPSR